MPSPKVSGERQYHRLRQRLPSEGRRTRYQIVQVNNNLIRRMFRRSNVIAVQGSTAYRIPLR